MTAEAFLNFLDKNIVTILFAIAWFVLGILGQKLGDKISRPPNFDHKA